MIRSRALVLFAVILAAAPAYAQDSPTTEEVLYALQDVSLTLDSLQVRSTLATDVGGSALLQLGDGTLIDVRLAAAADSGWSVRDISMVAGSGDTFRGWTRGWRDRVSAAENFLAGVATPGQPTRTAEELAPLSWFEDPDQSTRLWGMNPVTYRMMQALQMMPTLQGPTGAGGATNPVPRTQQ
ncbi:MAG TPA: hypothetical protein QGG47_11300 [Acidobacteriota bacterium]|nr:hypothetical protein [Acidobacteriota bacterium]